jgi:hypothetical protein
MESSAYDFATGDIVDALTGMGNVAQDVAAGQAATIAQSDNMYDQRLSEMASYAHNTLGTGVAAPQDITVAQLQDATYSPVATNSTPSSTAAASPAVNVGGSSNVSAAPNPILGNNAPGVTGTELYEGEEVPVPYPNVDFNAADYTNTQLQEEAEANLIQANADYTANASLSGSPSKDDPNDASAIAAAYNQALQEGNSPTSADMQAMQADLAAVLGSPVYAASGGQGAGDTVTQYLNTYGSTPSATPSDPMTVMQIADDPGNDILNTLANNASASNTATGNSGSSNPMQNLENAAGNVWTNITGWFTSQSTTIQYAIAGVCIAIFLFLILGSGSGNGEGYPYPEE